jgi:uncharacterized membrane protein YfcA
VMLGGSVAATAALVRYRDRHPRAAMLDQPSTTLLIALGLSVSVASGIVGIGGPMLTVPLLVVLGVPVLESLASAQAQSIVIATVGTLGYLAHGTIDWPLTALVASPNSSACWSAGESPTPCPPTS